jgi:hypothetical protein
LSECTGDLAPWDSGSLITWLPFKKLVSGVFQPKSPQHLQRERMLLPEITDLHDDLAPPRMQANALMLFYRDSTLGTPDSAPKGIAHRD